MQGYVAGGERVLMVAVCVAGGVGNSCIARQYLGRSPGPTPPLAIPHHPLMPQATSPRSQLLPPLTDTPGRRGTGTVIYSLEVALTKKEQAIGQ